MSDFCVLCSKDLKTKISPSFLLDDRCRWGNTALNGKYDEVSSMELGNRTLRDSVPGSDLTITLRCRGGAVLSTWNLKLI